MTLTLTSPLLDPAALPTDRVTCNNCDHQFHTSEIGRQRGTWLACCPNCDSLKIRKATPAS